MEKFKHLQPNQILWSACIKKKDYLVKKYQWGMNDQTFREYSKEEIGD